MLLYADVPLQLTGELELEVFWLKSADPGRPPLLPWWPYMESEVLWQGSSSNNRPEIYIRCLNASQIRSLSCWLFIKGFCINNLTYLWSCGSGLAPLCLSCWLGPLMMTDGLEWNSEFYGPDLGFRNRGKTTNWHRTIYSIFKKSGRTALYTVFICYTCAFGNYLSS